MADVDASDLRSFYRGRRVLVTGHTGFKGSWLASWLIRMGAEVTALALPPTDDPDNLFARSGLGARCSSRLGDIRDFAGLRALMAQAQPELVLHLAARALVQQGYEDPVDTFAVNCLGSAHVLEAARSSPSVRAVVCVTTDKVYRNNEWPWPYRETDELGGADAYSASKAAAEIVARAYRRALKPSDRPFAVATARGGNVIGGGDWSPHRLVPDIVRAIRAGRTLALRYPMAVRPWQHVLDLCYGYLLLGRRLLERPDADEQEDGAWNFGPSPDAELTVASLVEAVLNVWGEPAYPVEHGGATDYEAMILRLDPSKANRELGWIPVLDARDTVSWCANWYKTYLADPGAAAGLVEADIERFERLLDERACRAS